MFRGSHKVKAILLIILSLFAIFNMLAAMVPRPWVELLAP